MIRSSVDLPEPDGPSSAVSEPLSTSTRDVVERLEVAEPLRDVADFDAHACSSLGLQQGHRHQDDHGDDGEHERDAVRAGKSKFS